LPDNQTTPSGPKQDTPDIFSGDFRIHKPEKIVSGGEAKMMYLARQCAVCAAHKERRETGYFVNFALSRFLF